MNVEVFNSLLESFEAKKKYVMYVTGTFALPPDQITSDIMSLQPQRSFLSSIEVSRIVSLRMVRPFDVMLNLHNVGEIYEKEWQGLTQRWRTCARSF